MASFDELKQRFNIEQVAQRLDLELTRKGDQLRGECPACRSGGPRALSITPGYANKDGSVGAFYCFASKDHGDLVQLVAHIRHLSIEDAGNWLAGNSRDRIRSPDKGKVYSSARTESERGFPPLDYLEPEDEAVTVGLGFSPEIAKRVGLGYAPKGILRGTVAVPLRDADTGELLGYIGITEATLPSSFKSADTKVVPLKRA
jgi:DNA primase